MCVSVSQHNHATMCLKPPGTPLCHKSPLIHAYMPISTRTAKEHAPRESTHRRHTWSPCWLIPWGCFQYKSAKLPQKRFWTIFDVKFAAKSRKLLTWMIFSCPEAITSLSSEEFSSINMDFRPKGTSRRSRAPSKHRFAVLTWIFSRAQAP